MTKCLTFPSIFAEPCSMRCIAVLWFLSSFVFDSQTTMFLCVNLLSWSYLGFTELLRFIRSWISSSSISFQPLFFQIIFLSFPALFLGCPWLACWVMHQSHGDDGLLSFPRFFLLIAQICCWNSSHVFISFVFFSSKIFAWLLFHNFYLHCCFHFICIIFLFFPLVPWLYISLAIWNGYFKISA